MDPDPDPTPLFIDFKVAKKSLFFFSHNLPTGASSSNLIFGKNFVLKCYFAGIVSVRSTQL
jgi:hypothetical protein